MLIILYVNVKMVHTTYVYEYVLCMLDYEKM